MHIFCGFMGRLLNYGTNVASYTCKKATCCIYGTSTNGTSACTASQLAGTDGTTETGNYYCQVSKTNSGIYVQYPLKTWKCIKLTSLFVQTYVTMVSGCLTLNRRSDTPTPYMNCQNHCSSYATSSYWTQCCSSNYCNNIPIPYGVTSIADLEKCNGGTNFTECTGTFSLIATGMRWLIRATEYCTIAVREIRLFRLTL